MNRKYLAVLLLIILALGSAGNRGVMAQDPTIPTRTPTPDPAATSDDSDNPPPEATNPSDPEPVDPTATTQGSGPQSPTVTNTPIAPGGASPGSTQTPVATATSRTTQPGCDETPYVKAIEAATVYAGPGDDYEEVAQLGPEDMRPIIGRAYDARWWRIQFDDETIGWVADIDVTEHGNTAQVNPVESPSINGNTPTPSATWNPTPLPLPNCVPPTPTPTATPTETPVVEGDGVTGSQGGSTDDPQLTPTVGMVSAEVGENEPVVEEESDIAGQGVSSRNSEASRAASPTNAMNLILPLAGLALISGGIILALVSRKQSGVKTDDTN